MTQKFPEEDLSRGGGAGLRGTAWESPRKRQLLQDHRVQRRGPENSGEPETGSDRFKARVLYQAPFQGPPGGLERRSLTKPGRVGTPPAPPKQAIWRHSPKNFWRFATGIHTQTHGAGGGIRLPSEGHQVENFFFQVKNKPALHHGGGQDMREGLEWQRLQKRGRGAARSAEEGGEEISERVRL